MVRTTGSMLLAAAIGLTAGPLAAQNLIVQDGWEGFAMRHPDGRFDRCVLYNRTVPALNASPYGMLGITRDGGGHIGLMVFFEPRSLSRGARTPLRMRIGDRAPVSLTGDAVSDFHVVVPGPLDGAAVAALRDAQAIEFSTESKTLRFAVTDVGAVLDRLRACVDGHGR